MRVRLLVEIGRDKGAQYEIPEPTEEGGFVLLGRDALCELRFQDSELSRRHCKFSIEMNHVYIEDLNSLNGTRVNGKKIKRKTELHDGDILDIGSSRYRTKIEIQHYQADETVTMGSMRKPLSSALTRESVLNIQAVEKESDPLVGRMFGSQFKIIDRISQSDMSVVYKAQDVGQNTLVAIKLVRPGVEFTETQKARFIRGARKGVALRHPNVVRIIRGGNYHGILYLVMDFVEGQTLKSLLEDNLIGLDAKVVVTMGIQLLKVLQATREKLIVHRSIAPDNIMIGNDGVLRLTDFDLLKSYDKSDTEEPSDITPTAGEELFKEISYSAPECITHPASVDYRSDIYSVGAVLYHASTGVPAYADTPRSEWLSYVMRGNLLPPKDLKPSMPEELSDAIMRAMVPSLTDRYQDPTDFLNELQKLRASIPG